MRRRNKTILGSMDSLLDTMTNVVGILVILLVVTQLGVRSAVSRIRSNLPEVDIEQLETARKDSEVVLELFNTVQNQWDQEETAFKENNNLMVILNKRVDPAAEKMLADAQANHDSVSEKIEEREKRESDLQVFIEKLKREIEQIKKDLAESKKQKKPPVKIVRIPNPRPAPKNSKGEWFICKNGRVIHVDVDSIASVVARRISMMKMQLRYGKAGLSRAANKRGGKAQPFEYDAEKVIDYFKKNKIVIDGQGIIVYNRRYYTPCWLTLALDTKRGEDAVVAARAWSKYRKALSAVKKRNNYAKFIVYPDSFELYLKVREVANALKVPAGWQINTEKELRTGKVLPGIRLHPALRPPPPPPPPKPVVKEPPPPPPKPVVKKPKPVVPAKPVKKPIVKPNNVLD